MRQGEVALDDVQVGVADAAAANLNEDLTRSGDGFGEIAQVERARFSGTRILQQHGSHEGIVALRCSYSPRRD
jgi:hypothetical protein